MRSRMVASFLLWLVAVASVAGIAWVAINTAGRQVTTELARPARVPQEAEGDPVPATTATSPRAATATSAADPEPSGSPAPSTSRPDQPTPPAVSAAATTAPAPTTGPLTSAYVTVAGRTRISCQGSKPTLDGGYVQPAPGWSVQVRQPAGARAILVTFRRFDAPDLLVIASCAQGRARYQQQRVPAGSAPSGPGWPGWWQGPVQPGGGPTPGPRITPTGEQLLT